ncbi:hypothetical protein SAY87_002672 [Trapa incisa]|uniref:J domain-containing protein n=1 Tax=Trapa incisa TaxID=236973 RepID=A0AAN7K013_9MYRT|nr:hypothetical protein SAY87_002672 [Trapa incisa]
MECNKGEAVRAKEIAEKKFRSKDVVGAMKFALKAQNLYPELDGVQQMVSTLDVLIASEHKVCGECDWYKVLGVDPRADDETVRKQYRKIALSMHPDKNKSVGADEAFKLVSQAWSLVSDKVKRTAYDQKRKANTSQKVPNPRGSGSHAPAQADGLHNPKNNASLGKKTRKGNGVSGQYFHRQKSDTFWTVCHRCRTQYEYLRVYLNHNLLCPNCHKVFYAIEIPPPSSNVHRTRHHHSHQSQTTHQTTPNWGQSSGGASSSAANAFHQAYPKVKRNREEGQTNMKREEALRRKVSSVNASKRKVSTNEMMISDQKKVPSSTQTRVVGAANSIESDIRKMLMQKARTEICNNLNTQKIYTVEEAAVVGDLNGDLTANGFNSVEPMDIDYNHSCALKESFWNVSIDVPDPDFHDFDKDRSEKSFAENQVWAIYDDADGMPRRYALIRSVISFNPFKVKISWLIPMTNSQYGVLNWLTSGFLVTCGDFWLGRCEMINTRNCFSHKVRWTKGSNKMIRILPRKGDVWALYRNWATDWNELTTSKEIHKYDLVEILEDYDEVQGLAILPLVKVAGFRSMFHNHLDYKEVRQIPREEMSRFSHYVPSFLHRGQKGQSALKDCTELDPAATPEEFLHVVAVSTEEILSNGEDV